MGRGFLSGIIWGALVSLIVLVVASRFGGVMDLKLPAPEAEAVNVPAGSEFNQERPDAPPVLPATEGRPGSSETPAVGTPEPAPASPTLPETSPAATPETGAVDETGLGAPEVAVAPEIALGGDGDGGGGTAAAVPEQAVAQPAAPIVDVVPEPETAALSPETGAAPEAASTPQPDVDAPPVTLPDAPQGLRLPVPEIENMAPGVTTDRLPRIGAAPETPELDAGPDLATGPAISRNAVAFENTGNNPLVSLILIDVGADRLDIATLSDFPAPLSVAIDPTTPDAAEVMALYRAAGVEVVILTPLPEGASPADVEVAFQSFFSTVPEAVAVLDLPEALLQNSRPRAAQVVEILAETGHGLITYSKGLNAGLQIASSAGVPAATVFRDIVAGSDDAAMMKRFLDQGAFRAGQDGAVILVGEARAETLSALAEWLLGSRAASVTLAPVSAAISR